MERPRPSPIHIPIQQGYDGLLPQPSYNHARSHSYSALGTPASSTSGLSPRAALVAGLRSATDRRQRERERAIGALSPTYTNPNSPWQPPNFQGLQDARVNARGSSQTYFGNQMSAQSPTYAQLYAKQQELLATSLLIQQQQQRISAAMDNVINDAYANTAISPRPTSPMLPPRPQSSFSVRSRLFPEITSSRGGGGGVPPTPPSPDPYNYNLSAGAFNFEGTGTIPDGGSGSSPPSFKKRHRKSSSLGMAAIHNSYNEQMGSSAYSIRSSPRYSEYEIPIRQPHGPPPLEEITKENNINFASRM